MFFSQNGLVFNHSMPVGAMAHGQYYCSLLQDKVRLVVHHKQPELLDHGIILLHDNAAVIAIMICKIWCNTGVERCWDILPTPRSHPI
jgi:hypothetical protein